MAAHNEALRALLRDAYSVEDLARVAAFLDARGTLRLSRKPNGLYPAVPAGAPSASHYAKVWVRDTVMVVNHLREAGLLEEAAGTMRTLLAYFDRHAARFERIAAGRDDPADPMKRPHIRFDGDTLDELDETWPHAQNDALGYALWMTCRLVADGALRLGEPGVNALARFPAYFEAIAYWQDTDSGHWEEARKIESSSIGPVVAGLSAMATLLRGDADARDAFGRAHLPVTVDRLEGLVERGRAALDAFLPDESPPARGPDAALLFLVYPLGVVTRTQEDGILANVLGHLERDDGILRYRGDSYWCAGYKSLFTLAERTADYSIDLAARDRLLQPDTEAQWTLFDPIVSVIYGQRYLANRLPEDLAAQVRHLNRALAQITADDFTVDGVPRGGQCPEAYYVEDPARGVRVPNDHVPLAWTQANLAIALSWMQRSVAPASAQRHEDSLR
jgi:phosphorylase kinase alpha/beta subunit